ncbi:MAG: aldehyde dehydrogenase family protein, partial [Planctomycetota bacterium]
MRFRRSASRTRTTAGLPASGSAPGPSSRSSRRSTGSASPPSSRSTRASTTRSSTGRTRRNRLREVKNELGHLVTLEMGKIIAEGEGEVQEMIDICDFATGLSRQLYGLTMNSERPDHRMYEQWHPLGVVGVISAFNFPVAVWSWNAAIAAVCGDSTLWKPSSQTPLTAIACTKIAAEVCEANGVDPAICALVVGKGSVVG